MSYLGFPRLHFSGYFQADPSTVNNDPTHFDNETFTRADQVPNQGPLNGWWNPRGTASWRLRDCTVKAVLYEDGSFCDDPNLDPVVGMVVSGSEDRVAGKLVDLDPEQQMVSEIWGLQIVLSELGRPNGFHGDFRVAPFYDIWTRFPQGGPDSFFGAYYQSTIDDVRWSHVDGSRVLHELKAATQPGTRLSIKFNVDGYDDDRSSPTFTWGRIVGTIGAYREGEPVHFVDGRLMRTPQAAMAQPPTLQPLMNYGAFVVDEERRLLLADLGNTMPTASAGGPLANVGHVQLALLPADGAPEPLGAINYLSAGWYEQRAGIQAFPLTPEQLARVAGTPVGIVQMRKDGQPGATLLAENAGGWWVRADQFVYRLDAGDAASTKLYAMQWGRRAAGVQIDVAFNNANLQAQVQEGLNQGPPIGVPPTSLTFPDSVTTDADGVATLDLHGHDPRNPRGYIDGQVYGVGYTWNGVSAADYNPNSSDIVSVLVWDMYEHRGAPTWIDDVQPIFTQYANLYPVMKGIVDLAEYASVVRRLQPLKLVFGLPTTDPNYMPVTRDLSGPKRKMIRAWLENPLYMKITDVSQLRRALQTAIELEHSTIPPYLTALYSIKEGRNAEVANIIRSVVVEEMLHMSMACNLLNAIGGSPSIDRPGFVPTYPGRLPGGLRPDLTVTLRRCSIDQLRDVFMSIEEPAVTVDPVADAGQTIGWFYDRIEEAFVQLSEREDLFTGDPARQVSEWKGVGNMVVVTDLASARAAIHEIVEQGEGASPINPEDGYDELAHYYKFAEIVHGRRIVLEKGGYSYTGEPIPFDEDGVWPMANDPDTGKLPAGSAQRLQSAEFNQIYRNLLEALHQVFNGHPDRLNSAVGLMFSLGLQAQTLMRMPLEPGLPQTVGTAFQYPSDLW